MYLSSIIPTYIYCRGCKRMVPYSHIFCWSHTHILSWLLLCFHQSLWAFKVPSVVWSENKPCSPITFSKLDSRTLPAGPIHTHSAGSTYSNTHRLCWSHTHILCSSNTHILCWFPTQVPHWSYIHVPYSGQLRQVHMH